MQSLKRKRALNKTKKNINKVKSRQPASEFNVTVESLRGKAIGSLLSGSRSNSVRSLVVVVVDDEEDDDEEEDEEAFDGVVVSTVRAITIDNFCVDETRLILLLLLLLILLLMLFSSEPSETIDCDRELVPLLDERSS